MLRTKAPFGTRPWPVFGRKVRVGGVADELLKAYCLAPESCLFCTSHAVKECDRWEMDSKDTHSGMSDWEHFPGQHFWTFTCNKQWRSMKVWKAPLKRRCIPLAWRNRKMRTMQGHGPHQSLSDAWNCTISRVACASNSLLCCHPLLQWSEWQHPTL